MSKPLTADEFMKKTAQDARDFHKEKKPGPPDSSTKQKEAAPVSTVPLDPDKQK